MTTSSSISRTERHKVTSKISKLFQSNFHLDEKQYAPMVIIDGESTFGAWCDTEEEAKALEAEYAHQLIDGKPLNKVRGISQITLREAGNNALNNPQVGWKIKVELTQWGKKMKYLIKMLLKMVWRLEYPHKK